MLRWKRPERKCITEILQQRLRKLRPGYQGQGEADCLRQPQTKGHWQYAI